MNNLAIALTVLGASSLLVVVETGWTDTIQRQNRVLASLLTEAEAKRTHLTTIMAAGREELDRRRADAKTLRSNLTAGTEAASIPAFLPEKEGIWPTGKGYFYLPKSLLGSALFQQFQGSETGLELHPDCALVLGMSSDEAGAINERFEDLVARFKDLEVRRLERSTAHASAQFTGQKTSYRLPALHGDMQPYVDNFFATARATLGDSRAEVFNQWASLCIRESLGDFAPKARILTFTEVPMKGDRQLTRFEVAEEGGKQLTYAEIWTPPRDYGLTGPHRPRFQYRHLFGENAENRLNPIRMRSDVTPHELEP